LTSPKPHQLGRAESVTAQSDYLDQGDYLPHPIVNTLLISLIQVKTPPEPHDRAFATVAQQAPLAAPVGLLVDGVSAPGFSAGYWAAWTCFRCEHDRPVVVGFWNIFLINLF
jgi:hypothetical protein